MGTSTNAILCFGLAVDEDDPPEWLDDPPEWWRHGGGYRPAPEIYTAAGEWLGGKRPPQDQINAYFAHRSAWDAAHPMPVEVVIHCTGDEPMYIIAVPGTVTEARRGSPREIDPNKLAVSPAEVAVLRAFVAEHGVTTDGEPRWWLCSLWC